MLKKLSSDTFQFNWFDRYCGEMINNWPAHFSSRKLQTCKSREQIIDEDAPVINSYRWDVPIIGGCPCNQNSRMSLQSILGCPCLFMFY